MAEAKSDAPPAEELVAKNSDDSTAPATEEANTTNTIEATEETQIEDKTNGAIKRKAADKDDDKDSKRPRKDVRSFREQRQEYNKNVKTDYSQLQESSDPDEIRKQVEFYFSDSNLPMDTYLYNLVGGADNKSVPVKVIHSFKRMKRYQPYSAVVAALRDSDVLTVNGDDGKEEIQRKVPLNEKSQDQSYKAYEDKTMPRSIYVKGFGDEGPSTQFDLEEFFAPYGPINSVRMRRSFPEKVFKGSVFVEFDSDDTQKDFLALEPMPKFEGKELLIMSKKAYTDMKSEDIRQGKIKPNSERPGFNDRHGNRDRRDNREGKRDGGRGRDSRNGARDKDDWKSRRDDFQKRRGGRDEDGVMKCYNCGEPGHRKNDCPENRPRKYDEDSEVGAENGDKDHFGRDRPPAMGEPAANENVKAKEAVADA